MEAPSTEAEVGRRVEVVFQQLDGDGALLRTVLQLARDEA